MPFVSRMAVRGWQVGKPAVEAYARRAAKGAFLRMGLDAGFQFGTSYLVSKPGNNSRLVQAANGVNGTSVAAAGLILVGEVKTYAKFLVALGSAAAINLLTFSGENADKYKSSWHTPDFHDSHQTVEFVRNVILGTLFDQGKEYGAEWVAKRTVAHAEAWAAQATGKASQTALRWVTEARVSLPASLIIGGIPETLKKRWENNNAAEEEAKIRAEKAKAAKAVINQRRAVVPETYPQPR